MRSAQEERQDRSTRLWGRGGQRALEAASIIALGVTTTVSEALKNLILPGIGRCAIVDDAIVTERDLGSNFFIPPSSVGSPLATAVATHLSNLNPSSTVISRVMSIADFMRNEMTTVVGAFSIVLLSSRVGQSDAQRLAAYVADKLPRTSVMRATTVGLVGVVRIQAAPQFVVDDPSRVVENWHWDKPFPTLREWFEGHNPSNPEIPLDLHSHIPFFCILYHALEAQRRAREGQPQDYVPSTPAEWKAMQTTVMSMMRRQNPPQDVFIAARDRCGNRSVVSRRQLGEIQKVFNDPRCVRPSTVDDPRWFVMHAILAFREQRGGQMPCTGHLPDFETTTGWFLELQRIFDAQLECDASEILSYAQNALSAVGRSRDELTRDEVVSVCRHVWELSHVEYTSFAEEKSGALDLDNSVPQIAKEWYAAIQAAWQFADAQGRMPGDIDADSMEAMLEEYELWKGAVPSVEKISQKVAMEVIRFGGGEPVFVAAMVGAVVAQETTKLIQQRRMPACDGIFINGIEGILTHLRFARSA